MKIYIKAEKIKITIPVPLNMGSMFIRCIPNKYITKEEKVLALKAFKAIKHSLKQCNGMTIVEIESSTGEEIRITV